MSSSGPARSRRFPTFVLLLSVLFCWPVPAPAVWEFGPVTPDTRFPGGRGPVWELGMIYTDDSLYPVEFSVPAGCPVVLYILNLSSGPASFVFTQPKRRFLVRSGTYRRLDLGPLTKGEHLFKLEFPTHSPHHGEPTPQHFMRCRLRAGTWPGDDSPYRSAWLATPEGMFPRSLVLPAGRSCELALAGTRGVQGRNWKIGDALLELKPMTLMLTNLDRPLSGTYPAPAEISSGAKLVVR